MTRAKSMPVKAPKCPVRGWRWAAGLAPKEGDYYLWRSSDGRKSPVNEADLCYSFYPPVRSWGDHFSGYIRRQPQGRGK